MDNNDYSSTSQAVQGTGVMYSSAVEKNSIAGYHLAAEQTPAANIVVETPVAAQRESDGAA